MESKHTPGPWSIFNQQQDGNGKLRFSVSAAGSEIFTAEAHVLFRTYPELVANAQLCAAAPDLLAALERTLSWLSSYPGGGTLGPDGPYEQVRAVIAKALSPSA